MPRSIQFHLAFARAWEAKPFSNARMLRDKIIFAGFAAKAQAQVTVADKAELATAIRTAVFQLGHDIAHILRHGICADAHCRRISAPLMFGNICSARRTLVAAKVFAQHPSLSQLLDKACYFLDNPPS